MGTPIVKNEARLHPKERELAEPEHVRLNVEPIEKDYREIQEFNNLTAQVKSRNDSSNPRRGAKQVVVMKRGQSPSAEQQQTSQAKVQMPVIPNDWHVMDNGEQVDKPILDEEIPIPPELEKKSGEWLKVNFSCDDVSVGDYVVFSDGELIYKTSSSEDLERVIELILFDYKISADSLMIVKRLNLKIGVNVGE